MKPPDINTIYQVLALTYEITKENDPDKDIRECLKDLTMKVVVGKGLFESKT